MVLPLVWALLYTSRTLHRQRARLNALTEIVNRLPADIEAKDELLALLQPDLIKEQETVSAPALHADAVASPAEILLLAADDAKMREYLIDNLSANFRIYTADNGVKAQELAREINPDIVVTDLVMPPMRSDEFCCQLKSSVETSHIPVVMLSSLGEGIDIIHGLEAGATDYIIKPFDLAVLKVRLHNILVNRQRLRQTILTTEEDVEHADLNTNRLDREFLDKALAIIHEEIGNADFSIVDLGRRLAMSRTATFNKIKTLTGQTPNEFIRIIRLNHAKELLLTRKYLINEVAFMVGFPDSKYFSTSFKRQFGISPSKI
jgi:DNA-binding response OmpR family regulator